MCDTHDDGFCLWTIILLSIVGLFGLIGMLCFTAGYVNNKNFNGQQIEAKCIVKSSFVVQNTCSYSCNCDSKGNCDKCYYTCFDGYLVVGIPLVTDGVTIEIISSQRTTYDVNSYISIKYPNGTNFICYYNSNFNSTGIVQIQMGLRDYMTSYYVGIVFCAIAAAALLLYGIILLTIVMPTCYSCLSGCCNNITQWKQRKREAIMEKRRLRQERKAEEQRQKEIENANAIYIQASAPPAINVLSNSQFSALTHKTAQNSEIKL